VASPRKEIEAALAAFHGRRFCVLTNRGTTALTASLRALERPGAGVVFPAVMCSVPVFAGPFAGMKPLFADVRLSDGNIDLADLEKLLKEQAGKVAAVVPVHMFGRPQDMEKLSALCAAHGASVVEDVALSMGAVHGGRRTGGWGRLSCLSFVRKMIPLEMGGAVLTDEPALAEKVRAFVDALPPPPENNLNETGPAMKAFHAITGYVAAGGWSRRALLAPFEGEFRRLLLASTVESDWDAPLVIRELEGLEDAVRARRARAEVYEGALSHPRIAPMDHDGSCFFAYPVRLEGFSAEGFLSFAAERGYSFKRLAYPDVSPIFGAARALPNAERIERETVGFPVDDDQPVSSFWEYAADFVKVFEEYAAAAPTLRPFDWRGRMEMRMGR
jgi:dTDP-4-amino-4,6-dideoxygalactose transaminase